MESEIRVCQNCTKDFIVQPEDFELYAKFSVPAPLWCPYCRFIRKMTFINERMLYKRICGYCNTPIISMYDEDTPFSAWCIKCHISDVWDARNYGRDYDFSRNFFEQFKDLKYSVPHRALDQNEKNGQGCEYSNYCFNSKNVYLSFQTVYSENIKYSRYVFGNNKNCLDSLTIKGNDRGYELVQANSNYNSSFLIESNQCVESHFLYDCSNCVNCCLSSNLRNKSYVFRNKQLSKDEYKDFILALRLNTFSGQSRVKAEFMKFALGSIHQYARIKNSVHIIGGDFIENSKNVSNSYGLVDAENVKNIFVSVRPVRDSQDLIFVGKLEECYEFTSGGGGGSRLVLSVSCGGGCQNIFYCDGCRGCKDCFGCVGLLKKQYCILNKQYSKEEYKEMVAKIKTHMSAMPYIDKMGHTYSFGEFFPTELSPFAYNETTAFEENPLSKEQVISSGYRWKDQKPKSYNPTLLQEEMADDIKDILDNICNEIIECPNHGQIETQCTKAFKILPDELTFYRQMNLPLPRYCPNCRYYARLVWKNPFRFYHRECMCDLTSHGHQGKCQNNFQTMYAPNRVELVYCRDCYQKEVY